MQFYHPFFFNLPSSLCTNPLFPLFILVCSPFYIVYLSLFALQASAPAAWPWPLVSAWTTASLACAPLRSASCTPSAFPWGCCTLCSWRSSCRGTAIPGHSSFWRPSAPTSFQRLCSSDPDQHPVRVANYSKATCSRAIKIVLAEPSSPLLCTYRATLMSTKPKYSRLRVSIQTMTLSYSQ